MDTLVPKGCGGYNGVYFKESRGSEVVPTSSGGAFFHCRNNQNLLPDKMIVWVSQVFVMEKGDPVPVGKKVKPETEFSMD